MYLGVTLGSTTERDAKGTNRHMHGYLRLYFEKYIQVSTSRWAYGWLELLAEVGGYFGLFLGVSINQILSMANYLVKVYKRYA